MWHFMSTRFPNMAWFWKYLSGNMQDDPKATPYFRRKVGKERALCFWNDKYAYRFLCLPLAIKVSVLFKELPLIPFFSVNK